MVPRTVSRTPHLDRVDATVYMVWQFRKFLLLGDLLHYSFGFSVCHFLTDLSRVTSGAERVTLALPRAQDLSNTSYKTQFSLCLSS